MCAAVLCWSFVSSSSAKGWSVGVLSSEDGWVDCFGQKEDQSLNASSSGYLSGVPRYGWLPGEHLRGGRLCLSPYARLKESCIIDISMLAPDARGRVSLFGAARRAHPWKRTTAPTCFIFFVLLLS